METYKKWNEINLSNIDSLEAGEILANIVKIIVKHSKTNNGKEFSLTGSGINYIAEELFSLIKAQNETLTPNSQIKRSNSTT